ncbi:hypothetical protein [Pseudoteredinibacter isoporae]|uniref:Uncharacterized protein n=1 Tax=Pseudoteredinibacter isoporae TaxID=570281 RepID=A0A7X0JRM7_9GAMM|nr:hypothetical protein [Pseudoteredinibacter isoporae]MBB6521038.1 hypothetical protein [Pseudoteredinibacter isoporae]NHO86602.1 hypothetical protein [Pseudoteredinibacter isoporae]NIB24946.1 hypothetical protein [Pseudoteredinibacter isoporae]
MPRKTAPKSKHIHWDFRVDRFNASVMAGISSDILNPRFWAPKNKIYNFYSTIELTSTCIEPEELAGAVYTFMVYGYESRFEDFSSVLGDYAARNKDGSVMYRKVRGLSEEVYEPPKDIGLIDRNMGKRNWMGSLHVPPTLLNDMLVVLTGVSPAYLCVHELREGRERRIIGFTLQTKEPD